MEGTAPGIDGADAEEQEAREELGAQDERAHAGAGDQADGEVRDLIRLRQGRAERVADAASPCIVMQGDARREGSGPREVGILVQSSKKGDF